MQAETVCIQYSILHAHVHGVMYIYLDLQDLSCTQEKAL